MPVYIIADVDVRKSAQYKRLSSLAVSAFDARILVRGGEVRPLEGREPGCTVVLEFPFMARARAFYDAW